MAVHYGADTVMDLSTGGDIDEIREAIIAASPVPIGTVPIYQAVQQVTRVEDLTADDLLDMIEHQAKQGVDYMTVHCGVLLEHLPLDAGPHHRHRRRAAARCIAQWMVAPPQAEPALRRTTTSILRDLRASTTSPVAWATACGPGCLADASDAAQFAELKTLGELTRRAWEKDVQVMVEGPGPRPVRPDRDERRAADRGVQRGARSTCSGPLVTDIAPGYDHITSRHRRGHGRLARARPCSAT